MKKFKNISDHDKFILNAPDKDVEKYLCEIMGTEGYNTYMHNLLEYEKTLMNGTGNNQPTGILSMIE